MAPRLGLARRHPEEAPRRPSLRRAGRIGWRRAGRRAGRVVGVLHRARETRQPHHAPRQPAVDLIRGGRLALTHSCRLRFFLDASGLFRARRTTPTHIGQEPRALEPMSRHLPQPSSEACSTSVEQFIVIRRFQRLRSLRDASAKLNARRHEHPHTRPHSQSSGADTIVVTTALLSFTS